VALLCGARGWILFLRLDVFKMLGLHIAEGLVLKQHVVHELVPLDGTVGVSVNLHEQLVEFLVGHGLSNDFFETGQKLQAVEFVNANEESQTHNVLRPLTSF